MNSFYDIIVDFLESVGEGGVVPVEVLLLLQLLLDDLQEILVHFLEVEEVHVCPVTP